MQSNDYRVLLFVRVCACKAVAPDSQFNQFSYLTMHNISDNKLLGKEMAQEGMQHKTPKKRTENRKKWVNEMKYRLTVNPSGCWPFVYASPPLTPSLHLFLSFRFWMDISSWWVTNNGGGTCRWLCQKRARAHQLHHNSTLPSFCLVLWWGYKRQNCHRGCRQHQQCRNSVCIPGGDTNIYSFWILLPDYNTKWEKIAINALAETLDALQHYECFIVHIKHPTIDYPTEINWIVSFIIYSCAS